MPNTTKTVLSKTVINLERCNNLESIREVALDIKEGADMVMGKPGMPYLDIIRVVKDNFKIPVIAYQVSGEYSVLANGVKKGIIDLRKWDFRQDGSVDLCGDWEFYWEELLYPFELHPRTLEYLSYDN